MTHQIDSDAPVLNLSRRSTLCGLNVSVRIGDHGRASTVHRVPQPADYEPLQSSPG